MDKKLIVANWKMNPESLEKAQALFMGTKLSAAKASGIQTVVCVPSPYLLPLKKLASARVSLGAQNVACELEGAYTGQVSARMQKGAGVTYTIVGHSECRVLGESSELVALKIALLLKMGITPILCVGESARDTSASYFSFVKNQLVASLAGIPKASIKKIVVAYEPVWALSTTANRHDATAQDSHEMALFIRRTIAEIADTKTAHSMSVLYGGSVNAQNANEFLSAGGINGLLVGRASLSVKDFGKIIMNANTLK